MKTRLRYLAKLCAVAAAISLVPNEASAMPMFIPVFAAFAAYMMSASIFIQMVVAIVASIGASFLSGILQKAPARSAATNPVNNQTAIDNKVTIRQTTAPRQIIYGETRVGGVFAFMQTTANNALLHLIILVAAHEVDKFMQVWIDDAVFYTIESGVSGPGISVLDANGFVTTGKMAGMARFKFHKGQAGQVADADLIAEIADAGVWGTDDKLSGQAYVYCRLQYGPDGPPEAPLFSDGLPNITFVVRGKKLFDPRTGLTTWTDNAALCWNDYMTNTFYGVGMDYATCIDSTALIAAANLCEESVEIDPGGVFQFRYVCNGAFKLNQTPDDIVGKILTSMHGMCPYNGEKFRLLPGAYRAPTITLTDKDLRGGATLRSLRSRRERVTGVKGTYVSPENFWQETDFAPVQKSAYVTADGAEIWRDITLPFTIHSPMAQRLAMMELEESRREITGMLPCKLTAWRLQVGETFSYQSDRFGWTKVFEIINLKLNIDNQTRTIGVDLDVIETGASYYSWTEANEIPFVPPAEATMPDPHVVPPPSGLAATETVYTTTNGAGTKSKLTVTWVEAPDVFVGEYQVEYKLAASGTWIVPARTNVLSYVIEDLAPGSYNVRVAAVGRYGNLSTYVQVNPTVAGDTVVPTSPTGSLSIMVFSTIGTSSWARVAWTPAAEERVRSGGTVEIRWNATTGAVNEATWTASSGNVVHIGAGNGAGTTVEYKVGTYMLKFKSSTGVYSANFVSVAVASLSTAERPVEIVAALPTTGNFEGRTVYLIGDDKLYRHTGSPSDATGFTRAVDGADLIASSVTTDAIFAGAITAAKINVSTLSAIAANFGDVTSGTVTGALIRTANSTSRVEISGATNDLRVWIGGNLVAQLGGTINSGYLELIGRDSTFYPFVSTNITTTGGGAGNGGGAMFVSSNGGFTAQFRTFSSGGGTGSGTWAVVAENTGGGGGTTLIAASAASGGWAVYASAGAYGPFTGAHDGLLVKDFFVEEGDIMVDMHIVGARLSDVITEVAKSFKPMQPAIGIYVSQRQGSESAPPAALVDAPDPTFWPAYCATHDLVVINAVGEGQVNVCGQNGDIAAGDLIVTSDVPGKGMRQADDIVRACTVARARESVTFATPDEVKRCACVYMCG